MEKRSGAVITRWRWNRFCPCRLPSISAGFHYSCFFFFFLSFVFPSRCSLIQNRLNQQIRMTLDVHCVDCFKVSCLQSICMLNGSNWTWNSSKDTLWWIRRAQECDTLGTHCQEDFFFFSLVNEGEWTEAETGSVPVREWTAFISWQDGLKQYLVEFSLNLSPITQTVVIKCVC